MLSHCQQIAFGTFILSYPIRRVISNFIKLAIYTPPSSKGNERGSSFRRKCFFLFLLPWRLLSFTCPVSHGDEGGGPKAPSRKGLWGITASILTLDEAMEPRLGIQVSKSDLQDLSCSSTLCSILGETAHLSESQFCHV